MANYVVADDFKTYFGIDLALTLPDDDNPSNKVEAFLLRVENRICVYLNARYYRYIEQEFPKFTDYQKEHFKYALLEQAYYVLRNGDISTDSGYDPEKGEVMNVDRLNNIVIAPNCENELMLCGLLSRKIRNRCRWGMDGWLY